MTVRDTRVDVQTVVRRLDHIESDLRVAERLAVVEAQVGEVTTLREQVADLRRRVG